MRIIDKNYDYYDYLQDNEEAGTAFFGENAEILTNPNWQDVRVNG